jgi:hypothetical protein
LLSFCFFAPFAFTRLLEAKKRVKAKEAKAKRVKAKVKRVSKNYFFTKSNTCPLLITLKKELYIMFLTTALKDYIDQLNDLSLSLDDSFTLFNVFQCSLIYIFNSMKLFFIYILSFQWLTDFIELPCNFKANYSAILNGENVFQTILETKIGPNFFSFINEKTINRNHFGTGLLNSFFLALPLSVPHLLTIRAFLLNGIPAATYAAAGTILGQFCFLTCVLFGFEGILIPFFNFEPFNYIIGLIITVNLLYTMTHKPLVSTLKQTQKNLLLPFFAINFFLAWTEQTSIFQYFGNLTVNSFPTLLQNNFHSLVPNSFYLMGILIGIIGWTIVFGAVVMQVRNWVASVFLIPFTYLNNKIHYATLFITFVFCLTSIPYYGFDYLVSNPLGFVSQDRSLVWAKSTPTFQIRFFGKEVTQPMPPLFINTSPFDQSALLQDSEYVYEDFSFQPVQYWKNKEYVQTSSVVKKATMTSSSFSKHSNYELAKKAQIVGELYKADALLDNTKPPQGKLLENNVDNIAKEVFTAEPAYNYLTSPILDVISTTRFWEKYQANPVYKALTQFEINSFLLGQPNYQNLTASDEAELYKRRIIFERYLDSVEQYKSTQPTDKKAFAEKVYNQQFKGTFDVVRQFFPIELNDPQFYVPNKQEQSILKYDQPLYNEVVRDFNPLFHEELPNQFSKQPTKRLAVTDSTPFYIGWDGSLRKFLVKTNCVPGLPNGTSVIPVNSKLNSEASKSPLKLPFYFSFQSWPKTDTSFVPNSNLAIPYTKVSNEIKSKLAMFYDLTAVVNQSVSSKRDVEGQVNRALDNVNLPVYLGPPVSKTEFEETLGAQVEMNTLLPHQHGGLTWPGVTEKKLVEKLSK